MTLYPSLRIEGGLFAPDLLEALVYDSLPGQKPSDFGIPPGRTLTNEIGAIFSDAQALWKTFRHRLERQSDNDPATSDTRDAWVIPFLSHLGYELRYIRPAYQIDNLTFAISHAAGESDTAPPVHIVGYRQELGRVAKSGSPRLSPHALVQEYLNRSEALWGIVTNGRILRLLRDCTFVRRQAYVEFDLEAILEEDRFNDFAILYRLLHRSRLPRDHQDPAECLLEKYYQHSIEQGGRVREHLREGVEEAIKTLANGLLRHPHSEELRVWVKSTDVRELYRQLLRCIYRFLYLLVAEERGLMGQNPFYSDNWSASRLRRLCENPHAYTDDEDLWVAFRSLWHILTQENLAGMLGVPPLNGEMFELQEIDHASISNADLLDAFYHLVFYQENRGSLRRVNYAALDTEELGSVYESLLDYHPVVIDKGYGYPTFELQPGSERKSTGSYYTPPELVAELIRSALEPVIEERLQEAKRIADSEWKNLPKRVQEKFAHDIFPKLSRSESSSAQQGAHPPRTQPPTKTELAAAWQSWPVASRRSLFAEHALLSIRVLDPACGSGHFLLAAARRLGKELARIRTREDEPAPEHVREAVREVISHCIYGVDKNPLAVELCRVALWLEAHCEGKPLTFLNHRIKCGDSLVGVVNLDVLRQGIPDDAFDPVSGDDKQLARSLKKQNKAERGGQFNLPWDIQEDTSEKAQLLQTLLETPDDTPAQVRQKAQAQEALKKQTERERTACNLWTAAFFQRLAAHKEPADSGVMPLSAAITTATLVRHLTSHSAPPQAVATAEELAQKNRFFHWQLEFPEVFGQITTSEKQKDQETAHQIATPHSPGFDVILGNPPFMGGLKISGNLGDKYRHWMEVAYQSFGGTADLCAAFYRRAYNLLKPGARMGMVATNTIGQGDTRQGGLAVILRHGGSITFAKRFVKWPGAANVEVNLVAIYKPDHSSLAIHATPILDGHLVPAISSRLDAEPEVEPVRLKQNEDMAFQGDIVRGIGFVLELQEAERLLTQDPRNADCIFPYLNGEDLNSHPEQRPSRWVICFHDWDMKRAKQYPDLLRIVEERVKPERQRLKGPGDKHNREYWWQFGAYRAGMRQAIAPLRQVLTRSRVSELHMLAFVPKDYVYGDATVVFAFDDDYHFALLQSSVHEVWVWRNASSLESRNRYTPTDCFDTFPFPPLEYEHLANGQWQLEEMPQGFRQAAQIGAAYHEHRRQVMLTRQLGLTKTYNLFHKPACQDADILRLRELHAEMDRAILACYGWEELEPGHNFYANDRGQTRYTISPEARRELLARLLRLNLQMRSEERNS